jgi:DNA-directed RNA polymerase subunit M
MRPKVEGSKKMLACSCGYKDKNTKSATIHIEGSAEPDKIEVVSEDHDLDTLPQTEETCPKCEHGKARFWTVQTRAADEPETKFLRCEKCKHTWRDYN